jgi:hypothetical protein
MYATGIIPAIKPIQVVSREAMLAEFPDINPDTGEVPLSRQELIENARRLTQEILDKKPKRNLSDDPEVMWVDIGEHWNEIEGEMVEMQKHVKTGKTRPKQ